MSSFLQLQHFNDILYYISIIYIYIYLYIYILSKIANVINIPVIAMADTYQKVNFC